MAQRSGVGLAIKRSRVRSAVGAQLQNDFGQVDLTRLRRSRQSSLLYGVVGAVCHHEANTSCGLPLNKILRLYSFNCSGDILRGTKFQNGSCDLDHALINRVPLLEGNRPAGRGESSSHTDTVL